MPFLLSSLSGALRPSPIACLSALLLLMTVTACAPSPDSASSAADHAASTEAVKDVHSFANPQDFAVRHISLDLTVSFTERALSGTAELTLERRSEADKVILDTKDMEILEVSTSEGPAEFHLGDGNDALGRPLHITVPEKADTVRVRYRTAPGAGALQWLEPVQTASGKYPFLFTQSQPILARTWIPLQDTPQVRFTYDARLEVPPPLLALMSAENPQQVADNGVYTFRMDQAVPSYLMSLAVGELEFRSIGARTGVYAEPSVIEASAYEFAETEQMMVDAEAMYGPYRWGRYDILVLPPSFPYGGMENPRLTFATPTILAGDRSLTALIAHELAHSWSGNLATNATWNDLWINEGFTVYFERRIMEQLYGADYAEMLTQLGYQDLEATVEDFAETPQYTHLRLELTAEQDPDDVFSDIPYEKGSFFLRALEEQVGREAFDEFLREHFDRYAFRSLGTNELVERLKEDLLQGDEEAIAKAQLDAWIFGPGIPDNVVIPSTDAFAVVDAELNALAGGRPAAQLNTADWRPQQWLHFVRQLPEGLTQQQLADLDVTFGLTSAGNSELLNAWLLQATERGYSAAEESQENFLLSMGRRKFLRPQYEALAETPEGKERALDIYRRARATYHPVSVNTIDRVLGWEESEEGS
ncbi:MAG: M1 family metallopeptidase [Acidobacteriota bacterium]